MPLLPAAQIDAVLTNSGAALTPYTPLRKLLPPKSPAREGQPEVVIIGSSSPPIPRKLAEKVLKGEFVDLADLSPARLGAQEPTLWELFAGSTKSKAKKGEITSIEAWVVCFNTYIALIASEQPDRVRDLLAYSSLIVKAGQDFETTPWMAYDQHFRRLAAAKQLTHWDTVDTALWTLYFGRATPKAFCRDCGVPGHARCASPDPDLPGKSNRRESRYERKVDP